MPDHLSASQLGMLRRCEQQYALRYGKQIVKPPRAAMTIGSAFNDGAAFNLRQKVTTHEDIQTSEVVEVAVAGLEARKDETEWTEPFVDVKDEMPRLIETFQAEAAPTIQPDAVEEKVVMKVRPCGQEPIEVVSYLDVRQGDRVIELKTAGRSWAKGREFTEIQPVVYTAMTPGDSDFRYLVTVRNKKPKVQDLKRTVTAMEKRAMLHLIVLAKARADELVRDPDRAMPTGYGGTLCCKRWCGYWRECAARWHHHIRD